MRITEKMIDLVIFSFHKKLKLKKQIDPKIDAAIIENTIAKVSLLFFIKIR